MLHQLYYDLNIPSNGTMHHIKLSSYRWFDFILSRIACKHVSGQNCKLTKRAATYLGTINRAISNKPCLAWADVAQEDYVFPDGSPEEASDFCRNPDWDPNGPWCYTEPLTREYCNIDYCGENCCGQYYHISAYWAVLTGYVSAI